MFGREGGSGKKREKQNKCEKFDKFGKMGLKLNFLPIFEVTDLLSLLIEPPTKKEEERDSF